MGAKKCSLLIKVKIVLATYMGKIVLPTYMAKIVLPTFVGKNSVAYLYGQTKCCLLLSVSYNAFLYPEPVEIYIKLIFLNNRA